MISKLNQLPLSLFIRRLSKFDITLSLLKQEVYAIARPCYRNLPHFQKQHHFQKQEQKKNVIIETKSKIKILTGSFENRSSEAGKPNVTSDWFKYLAQCSKLFTSANVYSLKQNDNVVSRCENENPTKERIEDDRVLN
jgi:hypothetical protein